MVIGIYKFKDALKRILLVVILINIIFVAKAFPFFDADGFKSDMNRDEVIDVLKKRYDFDERNIDIRIDDAKEKIYARQKGYDFDFMFDKNGRLTTYINYIASPSIKKFILLVHEFNERYGKPIDVKTKALVIKPSVEESHQIHLEWEKKKSNVEVVYAVDDFEILVVVYK
jgi:hypothetical protein